MRLLLLLACAIAAGCASGPTIKGYPVGERICDGARSLEFHENDYICAALERSALGMLEPGHAPVVASETFKDDYRFMRMYGIGHAQGVVVFRLGDQTTLAFFVGCTWSVSNELPPPPSAAHCGPMEPMEGENWHLPGKDAQ
jgi:hypothetical protein